MSLDSTKNAVTRRTVAKGVAWSLSAATVVTAAPALATSGCVPVEVDFTDAQHVGNQVVFDTIGPDGSVYTTTLTSTLAANTATGQSRSKHPTSANYPALPYQDFNLNTGGAGWQGGGRDDGTRDRVFAGFGPIGDASVVLNQRVDTTTGASDGAIPQEGPDEQTIRFDFAKDGVPFDPTAVEVKIFDISSVPRSDTIDGGPLAWRSEYWDAVGFTVAPTSIAYTGNVPNPAYSLGDGAGTVADPYRRSDGDQPTTSSYIISDVFNFELFPSSSEMVFSNFGGTRGWHFISISGISFSASC